MFSKKKQTNVFFFIELSLLMMVTFFHPIDLKHRFFIVTQICKSAF